MSDSHDQWSESEAAELRKIFYVQAYEIVEDLQDAMLKLESNPGDAELLKIVKRHIHTLKGDSNSIGLLSVGTLCHRVEDVLAELIDGGDRAGDAEALEILLSSIDAVHRMLAESEAGNEQDHGREILARIERFLDDARRSPVSHRQDGAFTKAGLSEYQQLQIQEALKKGLHIYDINIEFHPDCSERSVAALMVTRQLEARGVIIKTVPEPERMDAAAARSLMIIFATELDAESAKNEACVTGMTRDISLAETREGPAQAKEAAAEHPAAQPPGHGNEVLRVEASKVDMIMDLVGELIIGRSMIDQATRDIGGGTAPGEVATRLLAANSYMERTVSDLQKGVMKMRMLPVQSVFRKFPRMVRDLCTDKGKKARVDLIGNETELDKGIIDSLGEPLAHLIRNAVDHGIELPAERRAANKPEQGRILLKAYHEASQIVIEVADDGRGIDTGQLRRKAVENGYMDDKEAGKLSDREAVNLIFLSGLSTASMLSETSGRGIGMDAVKAAVDRLKGTIEIETAERNGTLFRLRLPLTLAIINALLFEVGSRLYAVPVPVVSEVARIMTDQLVTVDGRKTLLLREQILSIVSMEELFWIDGNGKKKKHVLVVGLGNRKTGLLIDRLLWQQELVIKAIDARHMQTQFIAGASILGSGKVVLILDVHAIMKKAVEEEKKKGLVML